MVHVVAFLLLTHVTTYLLYHQSFLIVAHVVGPTRTYDHQLWHFVWKVQRLPPILIPDDMCAVAYNYSVASLAVGNVPMYLRWPFMVICATNLFPILETPLKLVVWCDLMSFCFLFVRICSFKLK